MLAPTKNVPMARTAATAAVRLACIASLPSYGVLERTFFDDQSGRLRMRLSGFVGKTVMRRCRPCPADVATLLGAQCRPNSGHDGEVCKDKGARRRSNED
jgi:hypothetical protein